MDQATEWEQLRSMLVETFLAGHKEHRPDLSYPESHSDMHAGMDAVLKMFRVERRPLAISVPKRKDQL